MSKQEEYGVFGIEYTCVKCGKDTMQVFLTAADRQNHPTVVNKMCPSCLLATPLEEWATDEAPKRKTRKAPKPA